MAKFELKPGETILKNGRIAALQGGRVKFPVTMAYTLTSQRFVYHDLGGWATVYSQLGILLQFLIQGKRKEFPLAELKISRGKYALNKNLLALVGPDGVEVLLDGFERSLKLLQESLAGAPHLRLAQTGEEAWMILGG